MDFNRGRRRYQPALFHSIQASTYFARSARTIYPVPIDALAGVYLGANVRPEDRDEFLALLPPGHRIALFQFRLDERDFALVARQIN